MRIYGLTLATKDAPRDRMLATWHQEIKKTAMRHAKERGITLKWVADAQMPMSPLEYDTEAMLDWAKKIDQADLLLVMAESIPSVRVSEFFRRMWKWAPQTEGGFRGKRAGLILFGEHDPRSMLELPDYRRYQSYLKMKNVGYLWVRRKASLAPRIFVRTLIDDFLKEKDEVLAEAS